MQSAWEPLEGTPETLNALARGLGLDTSKFHFADILGLEDEILAMSIPSSANCVAVIIIYPTTDPDIDAFFSDATIEPGSGDAKHCVFLKQNLGGTCATLAVVHSITNNLACRTALSENSSLLQLLQKNELTKTDNVREMPSWFTGLNSVQLAHQSAVDVMLKGKSKSPSLKGQRQGRHFVTWVHRDGFLWELNSRKEGLVCRGKTDEEIFLKDTIRIVRDLFDASKDESVYSKCSLFALISTG